MVRILTGGIDSFIAESKGQIVACFGAGEHFDNILKRFSDEKLYRYISFIVDNNQQLWGTVKHYQGKEYPVVSPDQLCSCAERGNLLVLVTSHWYINEIIMQMDQIKTLDQVRVFVADLFDIPILDSPSFEIKSVSEEKIPRIIHYCWFGKNTIPVEYQEYIETWKKCCPDYEIRLWNESNYDVTKNRYMRQAYDRGMWAFVSDYARIDIVHEYGGIYLDCDVELLRPLDKFLGVDMFCGFEDYIHIALGLGFGAVAGHPYLSSLLKYYEELKFIDEDGKMNLTPCPSYQTEVIRHYGIIAGNRFQETNHITVYPTEVFAPFSYWGFGKITAQTCSIHHYSASWKDESEKKIHAKRKMLFKGLYDRIQM